MVEKKGEWMQVIHSKEKKGEHSALREPNFYTVGNKYENNEIK